MVQPGRRGAEVREGKDGAREPSWGWYFKCWVWVIFLLVESLLRGDKSRAEAQEAEEAGMKLRPLLRVRNPDFKGGLRTSQGDGKGTIKTISPRCQRARKPPS